MRVDPIAASLGPLGLETLTLSKGPAPAVPPRGAERKPAPPVAILGILFDNLTMSEVLSRIAGMIESRRPHHIVTANLDFLAQARRDRELRSILLDADLVIGDGMPLVWASRLLRNPLPERVAGADLVPRLISLSAQRDYGLFFLGATEAANERAVANIRRQHPQARIAGHYSPPFRPLNERENRDLAERIRAAKPDVLLVAFGCPKAEKWIARHFRTLGVPVVIGIGATIDFLAGQVRRAPVWMQQTGLEWLFRLAQEPRRLATRYATDLWCLFTGLPDQWRRTNAPWRARRVLPQRECRVTTEVSGLRVHLPEHFDSEAVRVNEPLWRRALESNLLLDLRHTRFIDSTGIGLLLRLRRELARMGGSLVLASPSPQVTGLLKAMRLIDCFITVPHPVAPTGGDREPPGEFHPAGAGPRSQPPVERSVTRRRRKSRSRRRAASLRQRRARH